MPYRKKPRATQVIPDAATRKAARNALYDALDEDPSFAMPAGMFKSILAEKAAKYGISLETLSLFIETTEGERIFDMYAGMR